MFIAIEGVSEQTNADIIGDVVKILTTAGIDATYISSRLDITEQSASEEIHAGTSQLHVNDIARLQFEALDNNVAHNIHPALLKGKTVVTSAYVDKTMVDLGFEKGMAQRTYWSLQSRHIAAFPDLTIVLVDPTLDPGSQDGGRQENLALVPKILEIFEEERPFAFVDINKPTSEIMREITELFVRISSSGKEKTSDNGLIESAYTTLLSENYWLERDRKFLPELQGLVETR